ncbi:MCE family protein [Nocardia donostiensis]|uniref:ABC transporter substrate-binding protein n=1 Tax=Nocardia donostiensis TaxID=1538463 RepID=A0A1W0AYE1_9NOCA|nr:MCE family protein [Nocardia donostiensis]ONM47133.1 ABC transporter substrate-binding protein [Nocardia donostiensis]OQS15196.1 ABC transporter substrate-binding protein [Nocardia donostiensis]OQS20118.1 ABC transporter substrate-binding protein [Nocardia donostiensis]
MDDRALFGGRSPRFLGALGVGMVVLVTLSAFFLDRLPIIGAGVEYQAEFSEAAGLDRGDEVRVAGVKVGSVSGVSLDGDRVVVEFRTRDTWIGDRTTASIQIKTLLGQKYLALDPQGSRPADPSVRIPLDRTVAPYDVIDVFSDTARTLDDIDTDQLAASMRALSDAFATSPPHIRSAIDGVKRLSETVATRDEQLRKLFAATEQTTQILADRNSEFERLLASGGRLLAELNIRQQAISQLLSGAKTLSNELRALVADNEQQIGPALTNLMAAIDVLNANQRNISRTLELAAPFYGLYANVLGTGRWFDAVIVNITPPGLPEVPGYRPPVRTLGGN